MFVIIFVSLLFSFWLAWFLTKEKKITVLREECSPNLLDPIVRTKYVKGYLFFYKNCYNSKEELCHSYITDMEDLQYILNKNEALELICRELQKNDVEVTKAYEDVDYEHLPHYWNFSLILENKIKIYFSLDKTPNFIVQVSTKNEVGRVVHFDSMKEILFYIKNKILKTN